MVDVSRQVMVLRGELARQNRAANDAQLALHRVRSILDAHTDRLASLGVRVPRAGSLHERLNGTLAAVLCRLEESGENLLGPVEELSA